MRGVGSNPQSPLVRARSHDFLHWLPLMQRIELREPVLVWYSLAGLAPTNLTDLCTQGRQSWGWGSRTPRFWAGGRGGRRGAVGVVHGSLNINISIHVQEVCSKVVTFEEK